MSRIDGLSIVIPVFDEVASAPRLADRVRRILAAIDHPVECVIVDDGSTDGTSAHLDEIDLENVRVLHHAVNRGYGASLKTGIRRARYEWVAITDADETYPDDLMPDLFERALQEDYDMVVGARIGANAAVPAIRRPPKWFLRKLASSLSGFPIPDLNSGLRIMRKSMVERYVPILPMGFSFTSTITLAALSSGMRVEYVTIDYHKRAGRSKIRPIYDTLNFLQLVIRTVLWFNPLRVFIPMSFLLFAMSFIVLGASALWLPQIMDVTFAVLFMTGVMVMSMGMLADLIEKRMR